MFDIKKCIFIIDSPTTAFMVSLIAKGEAVNCIFERKEGIETDRGFELFRNFAKRCLKIASYKEIMVPNRFLFEGNILRKLLYIYQFAQKVKKKFKEDSSAIYVGPCTSSIMTCLTCSPQNIYYLYHGTIDCYRFFKMAENNTKENKIKKIIKKLIFVHWLNIPNAIWNDFFSVQGFSLVNINTPDVVWLNYKEFDNEYIEQKLQALVNLTQKDKWVMFCPIHDFHNINGVSGDINSYNRKNVKFLKKYISFNENVMIKCHPSIYQMNSIVDNNLSKVLRAELNNIDVKDIVDLIPEEIGGAIIPMEVIFRYCNFTKLICVETTTLWALKNDDEILKICDISSVSGARKELFLDVIRCLSENGMTDGKYIINVL